MNLSKSDRVCVFAHYDRDDVIADHVLEYVSEIAAAGFSVIFVTAALLDDYEQEKLSFCSRVILRENIGYDFASWSEGLQAHPETRPGLLLLCNDSVYGPTGDLSTFVDQLTRVDADAYAAVGSQEIAYHGQSWFMLFRPAAYLHPAFKQAFARRARAGWPKTRIVEELEIGLSRDLLDAGLRLHCAYDPRRDGRISAARPFNPMHLLWRPLLRSGTCPFLKVDLLRKSMAGSEDWRAVLAECAPQLVPLIERDLERCARANEAGSQPDERAPETLPATHWRSSASYLEADFDLTRAGRRRAAAWNAAWFFRRAAFVSRFGGLADRIAPKRRRDTPRAIWR